MGTYKNISTFVVIVLNVANLESSVINNKNVIPAPAMTLDQCLKNDSLSCLRLRIYRSIMSFFDQDRIDLIGGFPLVRERDSKNEAKARTTVDTISEEQILGVHDLESMGSAIASFVYQKINAFFQEHSILRNVLPVLEQMTAVGGRTENLPADLLHTVINLITGGEFHSLFVTSVPYFI
jgi:Protein of unknown function (DUF1676).